MRKYFPKKETLVDLGWIFPEGTRTTSLTLTSGETEDILICFAVPEEIND